MLETTEGCENDENPKKSINRAIDARDAVPSGEVHHCCSGFSKTQHTEDINDNTFARTMRLVQML
jgi:hypothetical protein